MSILSFLKRIWLSLTSLWSDLPADVKIAVAIGVRITENLKNLIDSPVVDIITLLIPGDIDDKIKQWLRGHLPEILSDLRLIESAAGLTDPDEIVAAAMKTLAAMDKGIAGAFYHNIAVMVAQVAADGKLSWSDGVYILEYYYKNAFEPEPTSMRIAA
ncbi:MAG TPA: hypothetical protein VHA56_16105 [Mucilaginibacter sp.]|nr:hypothetical protein [Mucilaginibacter sp.]